MAHPELLKALDEGRLFWRCGDQYGRSCNGGDRNFRLEHGTPENPGAWAPRIDDPVYCSRGYHATSDPLRFKGSTVELVEIDDVVKEYEYKVVAHTIRSWGVVDPNQCIDQRIWAAATRPYFQDADMCSTDLSHGELSNCFFNGAQLRRTNFRGATLLGSLLYVADMSWADLREANIRNVDMSSVQFHGTKIHDVYGATPKQEEYMLKRGAVR